MIYHTVGYLWKNTLDTFFQKQLKLGGYCSDILVNKKKKICMKNNNNDDKKHYKHYKVFRCNGKPLWIRKSFVPKKNIQMHNRWEPLQIKILSRHSCLATWCDCRRFRRHAKTRFRETVTIRCKAAVLWLYFVCPKPYRDI